MIGLENETPRVNGPGRGAVRATVAQAVGWMLVAAAAAYLLWHPEVLTSLGELSVAVVAVLAVLAVMGLLANGLLLRSLMQVVNVRLDSVEWIGIPAANSMYNLVLPMKGGLVAKGYYLKRRHDLSPTVFLTQTALGSWFTVEASVIVLLLSLLSLRLSGLAPGPSMLAGSAGLLVLWTGLGVALVRGAHAPLAALPQVGNALLRLAQGLQQLRRQGRQILLLLGAGLGVVLTGGIRFWFVCQGLGYETSVPGALAVQGLIGVSFVLSITPGNLGISEGITAASAGLLGLTTEDAMLAALVDRAALSAVICIAGAAASRLLAGRVLGTGESREAASDR